MKTLCLTKIVFVFLLLCANGMRAQTTLAQANQACLENTEQFSITSEFVNGETYVIQVGLPMG